MTAPRGPQRSEDRSDLTPAAATHAAPYGASEARAEVEAFLGPGWECLAGPYDPYDGAMPRPHVRAYFGDCIELAATEATYRAAVSALKQAWRDAVRPWCERGFSEGESHALDELNRKNDLEGAEVRAEVRMSRALGEDSNG